MSFGSEEEMVRHLTRRGWGCESPATFRIDLEQEFLDLWKQVESRTMISVERGYAVYKGVLHVLERNIPGDFAECGVWKGGSCLLMALTLESRGCRDRRIWLYDTFEGMTPPGEEDRIASTGQAVSERWKEGWWAAGTETVRDTLALSSLPPENFEIVKGDVCETLERRVPGALALLRLDTDWYASTNKELDVLYPRLNRGGLLLIDDYGHFSGARQAVDEYFADAPAAPFFQRSDYTGRCAVKESTTSP